MDRCPACNTRVVRVASVTGLHCTGDDRSIVLWDCPLCKQSYLDDFVDAWLSDRTEMVQRGFGPLDPADRERVVKAFAACPKPLRAGCRCGADEIADEIIGRLAQISLLVQPGKPTPTHSH